MVLANSGIWFPVNCVTYGLVPLHSRVLFFGVVEFVYIVFVSWFDNKVKAEKAEKLLAAAAPNNGAEDAEEGHAGVGGGVAGAAAVQLSGGGGLTQRAAAAAAGAKAGTVPGLQLSGAGEPSRSAVGAGLVSGGSQSAAAAGGKVNLKAGKMD